MKTGWRAVQNGKGRVWPVFLGDVIFSMLAPVSACGWAATHHNRCQLCIYSDGLVFSAPRACGALARKTVTALNPVAAFLTYAGLQMIDTLRSAASLLLATALTSAGCYSAVFLLFFAHPSSGWLLMVVGLPIAVGIVWLYSDLVGGN